MLKMNTKKAIENAKKHFLSYYDGDKEALLRDGEAVGGFTAYHKGANLAKGGSFACYYWNQRDAIREILEETVEEANKYSDDKVFNVYCHLAGRVYENLKK